MPTQDDVRKQGLCGHGFNYGGPGGQPRYCGQPSELGATFGDCAAHAKEFREQVRQIEQHGRENESAHCIERGYRAVGAEHFENLPDGAGVREVKRHAIAAQDRARAPRRSRRRSR